MLSSVHKISAVFAQNKIAHIAVTAVRVVFAVAVVAGTPTFMRDIVVLIPVCPRQGGDTTRGFLLLMVDTGCYRLTGEGCIVLMLTIEELGVDPAVSHCNERLVGGLVSFEPAPTPTRTRHPEAGSGRAISTSLD